MEDLPDRPLGPKGANGPLKGWVQFHAMGATALTLKPAIKGVATRQAAWIGNPGEGCHAFRREVQEGSLIER